MCTSWDFEVAGVNDVDDLKSGDMLTMTIVAAAIFIADLADVVIRVRALPTTRLTWAAEEGCVLLTAVAERRSSLLSAASGAFPASRKPVYAMADWQ